MAAAGPAGISCAAVRSRCSPRLTCGQTVEHGKSIGTRARVRAQKPAAAVIDAVPKIQSSRSCCQYLWGAPLKSADAVASDPGWMRAPRVYILFASMAARPFAACAPRYQRQLSRGFATVAELPAKYRWCPGEDSNLQGSLHWYLKPARLPIPPPGRRECRSARSRQGAQMYRRSPAVSMKQPVSHSIYLAAAATNSRPNHMHTHQPHPHRQRSMETST